MFRLIIYFVALAPVFSTTNIAFAQPPIFSKKHQYDLQFGTALDYQNQFSLIAEFSITSKRAKASVYGLKSGKDDRLSFFSFDQAIDGFQSRYIKDQIGFAIGKGRYDMLSTSYLQFGLGVSRKTNFSFNDTQGLSKKETYFPHLLARTGSQLEFGVVSVGFDVYGLIDVESISLGITTKFGVGKYWF